MIKECTLLGLEKAIQHALKLDPSMPSKLNALEGKVLKIIISPLHATFFIQFRQQTLYVLPDYAGQPDTTIQSSPLGLIRLSILPASKVRSLFNDHIKITGDLLLGQTVKHLFDQMDIDWEGHLAHFTGDVVAHQIGSWVRRGLRFQHQLKTSMRHHITDYLHEETRTFPPAEEITDFFHDVDTLALQVERISARLEYDLNQPPWDQHETP